MQYHDLIQLYFERSNALQSLWTLYVVIIGGVLAFASLRLRPDLLTTGLIAVLFAIFAFRNLDAIHDATVQRFAVLEAINKIPAPTDATAATPALLNPTLQPPAYSTGWGFHVVTDALVILTLCAMEHRRRRHPLSDVPVKGPGLA